MFAIESGGNLIMYSLLLVVSGVNNELTVALEHDGFEKRLLGRLDPLKSVVHIGNGRLRVRNSVEQTLGSSFGYLYGYDEDGCLMLYRDRLGTFPLFLFDDSRNNQLILFNKFDLIREYWGDLHLDEAGFWELFLFESTLRSRSLFSNVLQVPCASYVKITSDLKYCVDRYWHINVGAKTKLSSGEFQKESFERFDQVFAGLDKEKRYLLPLSGGEDSRLMGAFMARHLARDNIHLVTYGFDSRILEYTYAKQVAAALGLHEPVFHTLTSDSYIRNLKPLAEITGGCFSVQNSHLFDSVRHQLDGVNSTCSSAYSDGILGFDAKKYDEKRDSFEDCPWYKTLEKWRYKAHIPLHISETIESDLYEDFLEWKNMSTISSIEEYIYLVERNNKFHLLCSNLLESFAAVDLPFTEPVITDFYFAISNEHRHRKLGSIDMVKRYFPCLRNIKTVGSLFSREGLRRPYQYSHFRVVNFLNYLSASFLGDRILLVNPYHTEAHGYNMRRYHRQHLEKAVEFLLGNSVIDGQAADQLNLIPARNTFEFTSRYQIINSAYVLALFMGRKLYALAEES